MIVVSTVLLLVIGYVIARLIEKEKYVIGSIIAGIVILFAVFMQVGVDYVMKHRVGFCCSYYSRY
jgi:membrane protein YdbS with pleckstrin-like domain